MKDKEALLPVLERWSTAAEPPRARPDLRHRAGPTSIAWSASLALLPEGRRSSTPSTLTDRTERFLAAELIREQLFLT